jgi:hypothetical protein
MEKQGGSDDQSKVSHVSGEVSSVDKKTGALTVHAGGKDLTIIADTPAAKQAVSKVNVGETVRVTYTERGGKLLAKSVQPQGSRS